MTAEYTPTVDGLRDLWVDHLLDPLPRSEGMKLVPDVQAEFDRWLAEHDREVAAKALEDAAEAIPPAGIRDECDLHDVMHAHELPPLSRVMLNGYTRFAERLRARATATREARS